MGSNTNISADYQAIIDEAAIYVNQLFDEKLSKDLVYHNCDHTKGVVEAAKALADKSDISGRDKALLVLAAWFHDVGYTETYKGHEDASIAIATTYFADKLSAEDFEIIRGCIKATIMPQSPKTPLEKLMSDADLSSLGKDEYRERSVLLREEMKRLNMVKNPDTPVVEFELAFMHGHRYFTDAARELFGPTKRKNTEELTMEYMDMDESTLTKKKGKKGKGDKKGADRGIETMFRTASRNHINLSAIADNKANIMLSISAIILSFTMPILLPYAVEHNFIAIPTMILAGVCMLSIIFATLSTRPNITNGRFTTEDIQQKRSNLLFFGNFYNMKLDEFEWGMTEMMNDRDFLYGSLARDLYFLGKVLARKYKYLRICYNVFMFGLIIALISFIVAFAMHGEEGLFH